MTISTKVTLRNVAIFAIGLSAPAYAMSVTNNGAFNGYYGGVAGGVLRTESEISASATSTYANLFDDANQLALSQHEITVHDYSGIGDIYLGFGHFVGDSKFYLAGEIFGNWADRENSLRNWAYHSQPNDDEDFESLATKTSLELRNGEYGVDIRPGYLIDTNTMVYGRIGVAFNELTNESTDTFSFTRHSQVLQSQATFDNTLSRSKEKHVSALRLGIGLEHKITDSLAVTADYIYTYYGKVNTSGISDTTTAGEDLDPILNVDGLQVQSSGRVSTQAGMLGIKYYFFPVC